MRVQSIGPTAGRYQSRLRGTTLRVTVAVAVAVFASTSSTLALTRAYAGWHAASAKEGVRGAIVMPAVASSITGEAVISWVGLCGDFCANNPYVDYGTGKQWVQLGVWQGEFGAGSAPTSVHMYYENMDPCGDYYVDDLGTSPSTFWGQVRYDGAGLQQFQCGSGIPFWGYVFAFKKGSSANAPFVYGVMQTEDGRADANTEWHNTPAAGNTWFGCSTSTQCDNSAWGIQVNGGSGWSNCCQNASSIGPANPPYRLDFHSYWAFKTCRFASSC
jgi:hypothetical protein